MALRVLLADESSTIKKVMQLALQDFAVEVRTVSVGIDVLTVVKAFKPDIIFIDVLLSKKSGYDVCKDLKTDADTAKTPVVLMWSGFMELDETKTRDCRADRRLEKPFEAETLRSIVQELVPKTVNHPLSSYLNFPAMPEFKEEELAKPNSPTLPTRPIQTPELKSASSTTLNLDLNPEFPAVDEEVDHVNSIDEALEVDLAEEEFSQVPLHLKTEQSLKPTAPEDAWSNQSLGNLQSRTNLAAVDSTADPDFNKYLVGESDLGQMHIESGDEFEEVSFDSPHLSNRNTNLQDPQKTKATQPLIKNAESSLRKISQGSGEKVLSTTESVVLEKLARDEARSIIEEICWKILPEITERVVREEINRLLKDAEKSL